MNDPARIRALVETRILVALVSKMAYTGNLTRLHDTQPSIVSGRYDRDGGHVTVTADPTGDTAGRPDPAVQDLHDFDQALSQLVRHAEHARRILAGYGPPRRANDADRLALARANSKPDPRCQHCATIAATDGTGSHWSDADPRRKGPTDVGGRLPEPMWLCSWCCDWVAANDRLPVKLELEAHRDGRRVFMRSTPRKTGTP